MSRFCASCYKSFGPIADKEDCEECYFYTENGKRTKPLYRNREERLGELRLKSEAKKKRRREDGECKGTESIDNVEGTGNEVLHIAGLCEDVEGVKAMGAPDGETWEDTGSDEDR